MDVNQLNGNIGIGGLGPAKGKSVIPTQGGPSFAEALKKAQGDIAQPKMTDATQLVFSKHAVERVRSRGIQMGPEKMLRLNTALEKAQGKGSKDTLVLMDDNAFIMNVKNKTIVTAMDKAMLKENLFTNIDSTIIV